MLRIDEASHSTNFAAVSPDGSMIASGGGDHLVDTANYSYETDGDFAVRLWKLPESLWPQEKATATSEPEPQLPEAMK